MRTAHLVVASIVALGLGAGSAGCAESSPVAPSASIGGSSTELNLGAATNKLLAAARAATAQYQNIDKALADGFLPDPVCVEVPNVGGMGHHYANPARIDGVLNPAEPEVLLYAPENGGLKLVAVEYIVPQAFPQPTLFGRTLQPLVIPAGPVWELHVWLWKHNPAGIFEDFNPTVSCSN